jgi:hypothetical protein
MKLRIALLAISLFDGIAGVICGALLMAVPDGSLMGMQSVIPLLQKLPFAQLFFSNLFCVGLAMFLMLGVSGISAALATLRHAPSWKSTQLVAGIQMALFCLIEISFMPNVAVFVFLAVSIFQIVATVRLHSEEA